MNQKELVIRLIKDDLINTYLIDSFEKIGFYSENFRLNLSETIFKVMGIDDEDERLYELYLEKCSKIAVPEIVMSKELLEIFSEDTYQFLNNHKGC